MTTHQELHPEISFGNGFDFTDPGLLERGLPLQEFATLRRTAPVWWNGQEPDNGVGLFYGSANYDEDLFDDSFTPNVERSPQSAPRFSRTVRATGFLDAFRSSPRH